jgi:hypothetical protein
VGVGKACDCAAKTSPISLSFQDMGGYSMQSIMPILVGTHIGQGRKGRRFVAFSKTLRVAYISLVCR